MTESVRQILVAACDDFERARERLGERGAEVVPELVEILRDEELFSVEGPGEGWAPIYAAKLLLALGDEAPVEPLLDRLLDEDESGLAEEIRLGLPRLGARVLQPVLARAEAATEREQKTELAYLLGTLAEEADARDPRGLSFLLNALPAIPDVAASGLAQYGDPVAIPALSEQLDRFRPEPGSGPLGGQTAIELAAAIEDLGGELSAAQRLKLDTVVATRRAWFASLTAATGDDRGPRPGRTEKPSSSSRKRRKTRRKMKKKSRRKNR